MGRLDFHLPGLKRLNTKTKKLDSIAQMLVPRVLNWTKQIREAGAFFLLMFSLNNLNKNKTNTRHSSDFLDVSVDFGENGQSPRTVGPHLSEFVDLVASLCPCSGP